MYTHPFSLHLGELAEPKGIADNSPLYSTCYAEYSVTAGSAFNACHLKNSTDA